MEFPPAEQWPALPAFLNNLADPGTTTTVAYSMKGTNAGQSSNGFYIDNVQYCAECANRTLTLGQTVQWQVTNDSGPNHPFHIHINPFQIVEQGYIINGTPVAFQTYDPPIWEDTQALPSVGNGKSVCSNVNAGPIWDNDDAQAKCEAACPEGSTWSKEWITTIPGRQSVCRCCPPKGSPGYFLLRQEPIEFTGEFVNHCHILGHEDRGMMQNVQTVCANGQFGTPQPNAAIPGDDCSTNIPQAQTCPASYPTGATCADS
jgi:FtsP/CotA-like multicopper oxidase with cupredoxin domain